MSAPDKTEEEDEQSWLAASTHPLVLIVDDDDAIRGALRDLLEDAGFDTLGARHGLEALNILAALGTAPTFILLDLMMPVMDGWAFCDVRRRSPAFAEVPIIAISAVEISDSNRPAGIDAFLEKPIDVDKFARLAVRLSGRKSSSVWPSSLLH